jgi:putative transposase
VLTELKNRGQQDILIACVDGLKDCPDAINSFYPQTHIQLCIIHMAHNSLRYVYWKDYKAVTSGLKQFALMALDVSTDARDNRSPKISKSWRAQWKIINTLFRYPQGYLHHERYRTAERRDPGCN